MKWSLCGTGPRMCYWDPQTTPPVWTCDGQSETIAHLLLHSAVLVTL
ncbi:hypothetical protein NFI96_008418 [Prochilodus magdalenae]|nr:hypothetical protein NFI96_008418 [Prochilodus magdalenae]